MSETNPESSHPHTGVGTMGFGVRIRLACPPPVSCRNRPTGLRREECCPLARRSVDSKVQDTEDGLAQSGGSGTFDGQFFVTVILFGFHEHIS